MNGSRDDGQVLPQWRERMLTVDPDGAVELFLAETGDPKAEPLLVVHGGPDWDHTYLRDPLVHLQRRRLVFVDLRGCGRSTRGLPAAAYTPEAATTDLVQVLHDLGPSDVLGFSYGGILAQRLTLLAPELVRRLIVASSSVLDVPGAEAARPAGGMRWTVEDTLNLALDSAERNVWRSDRRAYYLELVREIRFSAEWSRSWIAGTLPEPRTPDAAGRLEETGTPLLLLQGVHDATFPVELVERTLRVMTNARAVVIPDAGHMAHIDDPCEWLQAVAAFLVTA
jgi:pimeloyl-ACP methyl ester carboxylesterase